MKRKQVTTVRVLVVDDSVESIELVRRHLESGGYEVFSAGDVQSALNLLPSVNPDLVITDLKMPGESGFALVRHISENHKEIGILVITGFPSIEGGPLNLSV